mmetsp:Transcript_15140/g.17920  ORF Transcript_15140/g.17920 Transcript_15140/m.17920 type:complete len:394 (+) Transcript_15140:75-1256(+)
MPLRNEKPVYRGLIVTTCKITQVVMDTDGKIIPKKDKTELKFKDMISFDANLKEDNITPKKDKTELKFNLNEVVEAVFLNEVVKHPDGVKNKFLAHYVTVEKAGRWTSIANYAFEGAEEATPLFCVHGFNDQPDEILEQMVERWKIFANKEDEFIPKQGFKYLPVPVIWPCSANYPEDLDNHSMGAGKHVAALVNRVSSEHIPRKSLLMHSMGNHVIFDGACGMKDDEGMVKEENFRVHFENIFMVSADIPRDVFWKKPWDYDNAWNVNTRFVILNKTRKKRIYGQKLQKANNFFSMLQKGNDGKPKGKIYVVYNPWDRALIASTGINAEKRLGTYCEDDEDKIRDEFKDYIKGYNIHPDLPRNITDKRYLHSYQFEVPAIKYYYENSLASED